MARGFLTLAHGAPRYLRMAEGLALSMRAHNPAVKLAVVTDSTSPRLARLFDIVVPFEARFGSGVMQKLHVDAYSPFDETLFIDSDSLVFRDPEGLWPLYAGDMGWGVKGWAWLHAGDAHYGFRDLGATLAKLGLSRIGAFNSGLFHFNRSSDAQAVFRTARELAARSEELGLIAFKNATCADEAVFALALELNGIPMLPWDAGHAMCTATGDNLHGLGDIDVLRGKCRLMRYDTLTAPTVLHFHMNAQHEFAYLRELERLRLGARLGSTVLASALASPGYARRRFGNYATRAAGRVRSQGLGGLVPERVQSWFAR